VCKFTCLLLAVGISLLTVQASPAQSVTSPEAEKARQILDKGLAESNPEKRKEAVIALSLMGDLSFSRLEMALEDKDVNVRLAACASLTALKDNRSIPLLEKALKDKVPEVSFAAAKALYERDQPIGKATLLEILEGEKKTKSGYFAIEKRDAMRMMKNPGGLFKFMAKQGVRMAPVPGLGMGVSSLEALMSDAGVSGRALAATMLAREKDEATFAALCEALSDKDWSVRAAAVHSLALRDRPEVRGDLVPLLEDKKEAVRYRAAAAYLRLESLKESDQANRD
jgi:HEAT repeat protein